MKTKFKFLFISGILLLGLLISYLDLFGFLDRFFLSSYLKGKEMTANPIVAITVEKSSFSEDRLWPWHTNWAKYLISFLLDLKPQKLILGPNFIKELKDSTVLKSFFENEKILFSYAEGLNQSNLKYSGHMVFKKRDGYFLSYARYQDLPSLGSLLLEKNWNKKAKEFYFLPQDIDLEVISASQIALAGFLKGEGYQSVDLEMLKDRLIFLEEKTDKLSNEINFLSAQLNSKIFTLLPREFGIYLGIFLFVILYLLSRSLRFNQILLLSLLLLLFSLFLHRFYFQLQNNYIALTPILTFGCLGFLSAIFQQEYEFQSYRRAKREMQIARILKEKEILPHSVLVSDGIFISVTRYKTEKVGGDFYQFLEFAKGELGVIVGWVPGEGLERVKHIMEIVQSWRDFASIYREPAKVIQELNNSLFRYAEEAKFATFIYLLYDAKKEVLKYVNAGHDPLIHIKREGEVRIMEADEPTPLGIARDVPFQEHKIRLNSNDIILSYSGGISQLISESGGFKDEFLISLRKNLGQKPEQLADEVFHDILRYYPRKPSEEWSLIILKTR